MPGLIRIQKMGPFKFALLCALVLAGCGKHSDSSESASAGPTKTAEGKGTSAVIAPVNEALKTGAYDDAAARLLELQASGREFTPKEAADYRKAMNEAYDRALEAAEKGDKRAQDAIKMIRATNRH
jgi:hypothetical protein